MLRANKNPFQESLLLSISPLLRSAISCETFSIQSEWESVGQLKFITQQSKEEENLQKFMLGVGKLPVALS